MVYLRLKPQAIVQIADHSADLKRSFRLVLRVLQEDKDPIVKINVDR
jgi:hypothetical protein